MEAGGDGGGGDRADEVLALGADVPDGCAEGDGDGEAGEDKGEASMRVAIQWR